MHSEINRIDRQVITFSLRRRSRNGVGNGLLDAVRFNSFLFCLQFFAVFYFQTLFSFRNSIFRICREIRHYVTLFPIDSTVFFAGKNDDRHARFNEIYKFKDIFVENTNATMARAVSHRPGRASSMYSYLRPSGYFKPDKTRSELTFLLRSVSVVIGKKPIRAVISSLYSEESFGGARVAALMFGTEIFGACHVISFHYMAEPIVKNHAHACLVGNDKAVVL